MSCEDIRAKLFAYFVHYLVEISVPVGDRGLNFIKNKTSKLRFFSACSQFLSLVFLFKSVSPTDTCRNHVKIAKIVLCFMSLQFEM